MKRPPTKKTATNSVARTCERRSCVGERISRKVQIIKLIQKITTNVTRKPTTTPNTRFKVSSKALPLAANTKCKVNITGSRPFRHTHKLVHLLNVNCWQKDYKRLHNRTLW